MVATSRVWLLSILALPGCPLGSPQASLSVALLARQWARESLPQCVRDHRFGENRRNPLVSHGLQGRSVWGLLILVSRLPRLAGHLAAGQGAPKHLVATSYGVTFPPFGSLACGSL